MLYTLIAYFADKPRSVFSNKRIEDVQKLLSCYKAQDSIMLMFIEVYNHHGESCQFSRNIRDRGQWQRLDITPGLPDEIVM